MKLLTSLSFGVAAAIAVPNSGAHADTLGDALARAYENNPSLQGSRALARAADETVTRAKATYGPTLAASASHAFTASRTRGTLFDSDDQGFASTAELSLSQPLFTSGRLAAGVDAARADQLIQRETLRAASQQLILDVVNAYVSLQRDIELYGVAVENYDLLLQQRDVTASRYRLRDSTATDVDQTANRLELAAGRVIVARATVENSAARYRNLVGAYPDTLAPPPPLAPVPSLDSLYNEAEENNPQFAAARYAELRSRSVVAAARAEMLPQVQGFATLGRSPLSPYNNTQRQESVVAGVSLSMPFYTGGQLSASLREALERNVADQQFAEQARRDMRENLATDWNLYQASSEAMPRYDAAVQTAQSAIEGVKRQETSGIRTLRDVLDVTNDLLAARTAAVQTKAEIYLRQVALMRDAGILSIEWFATVAPYDPSSYRPAGAALAGLPLEPVLQPIDRLLLNSGVRSVAVEREQSTTLDWKEGAADPLHPISGGDRGTVEDR